MMLLAKGCLCCFRYLNLRADKRGETASPNWVYQATTVPHPGRVQGRIVSGSGNEALGWMGCANDGCWSPCCIKTVYIHGTWHWQRHMLEMRWTAPARSGPRVRCFWHASHSLLQHSSLWALLPQWTSVPCPIFCAHCFHGRSCRGCQCAARMTRSPPLCCCPGVAGRTGQLGGASWRDGRGECVV
jgi:hypothetical protein